MRYITFILIILTAGLLASCNMRNHYPNYPYGGDPYGGPYDGGGYDPPKNYGCDWSCDAIGEWEGFLWESYRSDGLQLSKKTVAMRVRFVETTYDYSGRNEWVDIDVLVDGRPAASAETSVSSSGYVSFGSYRNDIDFELYGKFKYDDAIGDIDLSWNEKFVNKYNGNVEEYWVHLKGDYDLAPVKGAQWSDAWALLDNFGEDAWTLSDDVWGAATLEGVTRLSEIEETFARRPTD